MSILTLRLVLLPESSELLKRTIRAKTEMPTDRDSLADRVFLTDRVSSQIEISLLIEI